MVTPLRTLPTFGIWVAAGRSTSSGGRCQGEFCRPRRGAHAADFAHGRICCRGRQTFHWLVTGVHWVFERQCCRRGSGRTSLGGRWLPGPVSLNTESWVHHVHIPGCKACNCNCELHSCNSGCGIDRLHQVRDLFPGLLWLRKMDPNITLPGLIVGRVALASC